ncbi:3-oxoacyl-ACP synthase [Trinickia dabaoshanensis]|uniref:3-oxoacyl-ACP synthase n=2 Tax=Trinickia dabaoshanensis TaxID=564714 RepID=A0A2N7VI43_9BURK|nr:3-oxoacyl-ACP synthase [Trinickia dabaoshanensis]TAM55323.1 MAG: 3-oxoacyl-ACP synthase [Paraburkholderia sp.]
MSQPSDHAGVEPRIVASARYIPYARVAPDASIEPVAATGITAREVVMQAVYADTLRWREARARCGEGDRPASQVSLAADRPVANEPRMTLSDMALTVAQTLLDALPQRAELTPDQIIVCTTSFEHDLALSCACRLHCELRSSRAPFAIGQLQSVSFLMALDVALAMMAVDTQMRAVLIVAAERWLPPFVRRVDALTVMGDGAAAVLIARSPIPGWRVRSLTIRTPGPGAFASTDRGLIGATTLTQAIDDACTRAKLCAADIDWILPPSAVEAQLIRELGARSGLPVERIWHEDQDAHGHLCAADTPARLDALLRSIAPSHGQCMLVSSLGFQGQAACALLDFRGENT